MDIALIICCLVGLVILEGASGLSEEQSLTVDQNESTLNTDFTMMQESDEFAIQHIESGFWVQPRGRNEGDIILLQESFNDNCRFKVLRRPDTLLVHIQHVSSGKYLHPKGGSSNPGLKTLIVLGTGSPFYTLYKFVQFKNIIKHQMGKKLIPDRLDNRPGTWIHLNDHDKNSHFRVVSYSNKSQEFLIYGNATVTAYWRLVFSLDTPAIASQTFEETVQVGYSKTESSQTAYTFAWEVTASKQFWFAEMSIALSLKKEVMRSSSETWSKSVEQKIKVTVEKGSHVAVWQRFYEARQMDHWSVQQSNRYAHTKHSSINPDDEGASGETYWI